MPFDNPGGDPSVVTEPVDPGFFPGDENDDDYLTRHGLSDAEEVPFDPQLLDQALSNDASLSEVSPGRDGDDGAVKDPIADLEFDPKHRNDFDGLLYIGALTHQFQLFGHSFVIHTLSTDEILEVSLLVKEWEGTLGQNRAYLTAMAAACCDFADGQRLHTPLGPVDNEVRGRFTYVRANWFPWVVDGIYEKLMALEARVTEILSLMGEGSG